MRTPLLFAGCAAMMLSFIAAKNTVVYLILSVAVISVYVFLYFIKVKRLHFLFAALLLFILTAATFVNISAAARAEKYVGETTEVAAVITSQPQNYGIGYSYTARVETVDEEKLRLTNINLNTYDDSLCPGDRITAIVALYQNENKESFYAENIFIHGDVEELITIRSQHNTLQYKIYTLQVYIKELIADFIEGDTGQLIVAVITGDRSGISDETYDLIKQSGVAHMIVVSGMHFSVICAAVMWLFRRILPGQFAQGFAMLALVFFIMLFCGFSKSVLRAGITYIILILAVFIRRDGDSLSALSFAVIIVMLINPFAAYSVSFQLTISATYGILVLAPMISNKVNKLLHTENIGFIKETVEVTAVTVSANIMTLPIILYVYEWVSTVSLLTNILINYSVSAVLVIGIIAVLVGKVQFLAYPCFFITGLLSKYSLWVIEFFGSLPFATVNFSGKPLAVILCMLYLVVYLYYTLLRKSSEA